jgi:hypothetical protein
MSLDLVQLLPFATLPLGSLVVALYLVVALSRRTTAGRDGAIATSVPAGVATGTPVVVVASWGLSALIVALLTVAAVSSSTLGVTMIIVALGNPLVIVLLLVATVSDRRARAARSAVSARPTAGWPRIVGAIAFLEVASALLGVAIRELANAGSAGGGAPVLFIGLPALVAVFLLLVFSSAGRRQA